MKLIQKHYFLSIFFLCALAAVSFPMSAHAQNEDDEGMVVEDILQPVEDKYKPVTRQSLSKLYWAAGKLDLTDLQAISNYLYINECDLYTQYYHDDFEWKKLLNATREYLSKNMSRFSTHFELIVPITLDRYNIEEQTFALTEDSQIVNAKRLDVKTVKQQTKSQKKETDCDTISNIDGYNDSLILVLNQPFTLAEIEVPVELADLYLQEAQKNYENLPAHLKLERYERLAYLRMKFRVTAYKEETRDVTGEMRAVVLGMMDGYEIYADYEKYKPIASQDLTYKKRRLRRRKPPEERTIQPVEERKQQVDFSE